MNTMEILTLLLVIFTALTYLDNHKKKYASHCPKVRCLSLLDFSFSEGNRISASGHLLIRLYNGTLVSTRVLFYIFPVAFSSYFLYNRNNELNII